MSGRSERLAGPVRGAEGERELAETMSSYWTNFAKRDAISMPHEDAIKFIESYFGRRRQRP